MAAVDLIIRAGSVVSPDGVDRADIAIADGKIVKISPEISATAAGEIDAEGLHLFPGSIDAHVHFNEPGRTEWEGWATGSSALAAGGGTVCFEMPLNASPPTIDGPAFDVKLAAASAQSHVDFALWGGLVPGNIEYLAELAERGVIGFKAFMSRSGTDDFPAVDDLTLYEGMREAARLGKIVAVHAESDTITNLLATRAVAEGRYSARDYLASRPVIAELEAINRAIFFAGETGCSLHIVHVSNGRGVALVAGACARGIDVTCETCAHYLVLTEDDVTQLGAIAKCAPPLRSREEIEKLWGLIANGTLPMITSDHSPAPAAMKTGDDFFKFWGGISGVQSTLPILLTEGHHQRGVSLPIIATVMSSFVAKRFHLPSKGTLEVGKDADVAMVAVDREFTLREDDLLDRHRLSPYRGRTFRGQVVGTILHGETILCDGRIVGTPRGRFLRPMPL